MSSLGLKVKQFSILIMTMALATYFLGQSSLASAQNTVPVNYSKVRYFYADAYKIKVAQTRNYHKYYLNGSHFTVNIYRACERLYRSYAQHRAQKMGDSFYLNKTELMRYFSEECEDFERENSQQGPHSREQGNFLKLNQIAIALTKAIDRYK